MYSEVLVDIGQHHRTKFFKEVYDIENNLIGEFDPLLSQVLDLQEKIQRQPIYKVHEVTYDKNLYEYIQYDEPLVDEKTSYTLINDSLDARFKNDWISFMNFARKHRGWKVKVEKNVQ